MKTTLNGRQPENIKSGLYQQPLIGSYSNFKLKLRWSNNIFYKSFKWGRTPMEDDLKIFKVEYLNNHLMDRTQLLNISLDDQIIFYKSLKWRRPPMEEDLKSRISQQPLIGSFSNIKLKLIWPNHILQILKMKTNSKY